MKIIEGNLLDLFKTGEFNAIAHGCNCFNTMNSGVAKQLREQYPAVYEADLTTLSGDFNKLGTLTVCSIAIPAKRIYNLYTQYNYGYDKKCYLNYDALSTALWKLNKYEKGNRVGLPYLIGCGLAGGNPIIVEGIIERQLRDCDVTLVKLKEE